MYRSTYFSNLRMLMLSGDWFLLCCASLLVVSLFLTLWHPTHAAKVLVRQGDHVFATLSLNQSKSITIAGPLGNTMIIIDNGRARIQASPCRNQYCVHQGWLNHTGQVAVCLPNRVSLELIGQQKAYDSLAY